MLRECKKHGMTKHRLEGAAKHMRCCKCRTERVTIDRQKLKADLVAHLGGKCQECGYNKSVWSMHFHHLNPDEKEIHVSHLIRDRKREAAFCEAEKCVLLCSNCHGEAEEQKYLETTLSSVR